MINHKISVRYATSLLESSLEKKTLDSLSREVELVYHTLKDNPELNRMLYNPVIKPEIKQSVFGEVFANRVSTELLQFLKFVLQKGREEQLIHILHKFIELRDEQLGIVNVAVTSAFDFTPEQEEKLRKRFEERLGKKVRFKFSISKEIIGGFIAKVNDTIYDASVKHQLELLKKEFLSGGISLN